MLRYTSIAALALAGVTHLLIVPEHFSHDLAHGTFFILIGIAQLVWAVAFWRSTSPILCWAGLAASGGTIAVWVLTQLILVSVASAAELVGPSVVVSKSSELIGFFALVVLAGGGQLAVHTKWSVARSIGGALILSLVFAIGVWGSGHLAEVIFPELVRGQNQAPGLVNEAIHAPDHEHAHQ